MAPSLISVNVGLPRDVAWQGKIVHTGIWKRPVAAKVMAHRLNLDGDGQGDLMGHGGEHRAVMVYQLDSYRYWEAYLQRHDFELGQFGENLTVDGLPDSEVCIGDRYRIGGALFEVTQPRVTCYRLGIRMNNPAMPALLVSHRRPGFYLRVIEEGEIGAGDAIVKVADGPGQVTVQEIDGLLYLPGRTLDRLKRALEIPTLSAGWKGSLKALAAAEEKPDRSGNAGLAPSQTPPPMWQGFRPLRVAGIHRETIEILSFVLESEDRSPLPTPLPGQFLVLKLKLDAESEPILRNYSMSGSPGTGRYRISVKRAAGPGSRYLHDRLQAGDLLEVSAPRGSFTLVPGDRPVVLISAGIGATPVLAMLHALTDSAANTAREVWWCYAARNGAEHPFAEEARDLLRRLYRHHSLVAYSKPADQDLPGKDYDVSGRLNVLSLRAVDAPKDADFYLCGPSAFLADFTADLKSWGVPGSRIHSELFGVAASKAPGIVSTPSASPHPPAEKLGTGPKVSFTRSGVTAPWDSRYGSLLEFAEACDVPVRWACRTGVCHRCESGLIDGSVTYAPEPLDLPVDGNVLLCCSTPLSAVELDL
jgi:ferredoxin-NADP reductase/MOSC domain-containing protein YiiM/ferredoxin